MPEQSDTSPPPERDHKRRHRVAVWSLVVLASVLLIFSLTANWVQHELLDSSQVASTTDEILKEEDVQTALSTYAVDQLYANVDVQGELEKRLPSAAQPLAAPITAATRQLALSVAERALASPQVQELVASAVERADQQFVSLVEDENEYVSTTGGEVVLLYGSVIADLAARLGLDPATITKIQDVVQSFSQDLKQELPKAQSEIESVRAGLAQAQEGELSPEVQQDLQTLRATAAKLQDTIAGLQKSIKGVQGSVPDQLQGRVASLEDRLTTLDGRLAALEARTAAVVKDPSQADVEGLDATLASLQAGITTALESQAVQTPGELVLLDSDQLEGVQTLVGLLRNLGIVLPILVLLLYVAAIYLAKGWRRSALIGAGAGILVATLLVLLVLRLAGDAIVDSVTDTETVQPAVQSVWDILSDGLRERARFILVIGLAFIAAGLLAGPGRAAVATRRFLAPHLSERPAAVYLAVAVLFLLWLAFIPGIDNLGQVLVIVMLAVLAVVGIEILRRQTAQEFAPGPTGS
jgi:hypothetical protein